jgi:signal transduction histidine kinase
MMGPELFSLNERFIRAAIGGKAQTFERTLTKPSGQVGHTLAQYIPDFACNGDVLGMYVLVSDVTPLKEAERRLEEANVLLAEAAARAEASARSKRDFASNLSHEVRNPLSTISIYAELLQRSDEVGERGRLLINRIVEASEALLGTVNNVLDFSKLEAGLIEVERRPFDPEALGERTLALFEPQAERRQVELCFDNRNVPHCLGDVTRIRQILLNLIGNAVKFTSNGNVTLRVAYDAASETLRYDVIDSGLGIAKDKQAKLFQRFVQADETVGRDFGGTGLGLAICDGLAKAMAGRIGLASVVGGGSHFWVELPCQQEGGGGPPQTDNT